MPAEIVRGDQSRKKGLKSYCSFQESKKKKKGGASYLCPVLLDLTS